MQKIVPHLWFDTQGFEAALFYSRLFERSAIISRTAIGDTPSGKVDLVGLGLLGQEFSFLSAGPAFSLTPAVSFLVSCGSRDEVDRLWAGLAERGMVMMPLDSYPFSEHYGWIQDRFGVSWQLMYTAGGERLQSITPTMMFTGKNNGRAEEAVRFYTSLFGNSTIGHIEKYGPGMDPDSEDSVKHAGYSLAGQGFAAMDSAYNHGFTFTEAISFMVYCDSQEELDHYWYALSAVPEAEQCGWLKDKFGFSWQIVPRELGRLMSDNDPGRVARVTQAFLGMKKLDILKLERAAIQE